MFSLGMVLSALALGTLATDVASVATISPANLDISQTCTLNMAYTPSHYGSGLLC